MLTLMSSALLGKMFKTNKQVRSSYVSAYAYVYVAALYTFAYPCVCGECFHSFCEFFQTFVSKSTDFEFQISEVIVNEAESRINYRLVKIESE